jgi:hypothetical protein
MPNALAVSTSPPNKQWAGGYGASPLKYRFSAIALFHFRVRWLLICGADCFVRQLAARHHSGFYSESWQDNSLQ